MTVVLWFLGFLALLVATLVASARARAMPGDIAGRWIIAIAAVAYVGIVVAAVWTWGGATAAAEIGNGGFYAELEDGSPARLIVHLSDGTAESVTPLPCPITTPDCTS